MARSSGIGASYRSYAQPRLRSARPLFAMAGKLDPRARKVLYRTDAGLPNVQCVLTRRGGRAPNAGCLPKRAPTLENCMDNDKTKEAGTNRDPITGAPGAHPVGVGLGAAAGGIAGGIAAGAAVGTVAAGPVGTAVGAAVGAIAGGLGGKAVAEKLDPTVEVTSTEPDLRTTTVPLLE